MRKTFKILFLLVLTAVVWLSYPKRSFAQGTFECVINHVGMCLLKNKNCSSGYEPADCSIWRDKPTRCETTHTCIPEALASSCKTKLPYVSCPSDYPIECIEKYQCCKNQANCDAISTIDYGCDPGTGNGNDGITTAIGCIPINNLNEFIKWFLSKLIFVASGIAFLLMAFGAFQILTSAGSPERVQAGKELITSALAGLIFIILSLFLLKLIGVDILQIPGFGK